ncbi:MAG: PilZ domain-containing protein [Candidatus Omnitrophica bacterium]|nr:PilZ domain-containing protein [Candidatus Omnitrophota bacterium]MBU1872092.1 PilZ domain-containing protein [Candidatus Omnitrophota bacterium]
MCLGYILKFDKESLMGWQEKRRFKRAYIKFSVEYRGKSFWQIVEAQDISAGGMFIATQKIEPPQTKVEIMFTFGKDNKRVIHAEGVVAWNRREPGNDEEGNILPAGMGIMFIKFLPSRSQNFIKDLIENGGE